MKNAPADYVFSVEVYVFSVEVMNPETGLYDIKGITSDEAIVEGILDTAEDEVSGVYRIQVFTLGQMEGSIRTFTSIKEFMEFQ